MDRVSAVGLLALLGVAQAAPPVVCALSPEFAAQGAFRFRWDAEDAIQVDPWGQPYVVVPLSEMVGERISRGGPRDANEWSVYSVGPNARDEEGNGDDVSLVARGQQRYTPEQHARAEVIYRLLPILLRFLAAALAIAYLAARLISKPAVAWAVTGGTGLLLSAIVSALDGFYLEVLVPQTVWLPHVAVSGSALLVVCGAGFYVRRWHADEETGESSDPGGGGSD